MIIIDKEKPRIISCAENQTKIAPVGQLKARVEWPTPTAIDNSGEPIIVACIPQSGSNFTIGQTEVECKAVDSSGNQEACSFYINVTGTHIKFMNVLLIHSRSSKHLSSQYILIS